MLQIDTSEWSLYMHQWRQQNSAEVLPFFIISIVETISERTTTLLSFLEDSWKGVLTTTSRPRSESTKLSCWAPFLGFVDKVKRSKENKVKKQSPLPKKQFWTHPAACEGHLDMERVAIYCREKRPLNHLLIPSSSHLATVAFQLTVLQTTPLQNDWNWLSELTEESGFKVLWDLQVNMKSSLEYTPTRILAYSGGNYVCLPGMPENCINKFLFTHVYV